VLCPKSVAPIGGKAKSIDVKFRKFADVPASPSDSGLKEYLLEQANLRLLAVTAIIVGNAAAGATGFASGPAQAAPGDWMWLVRH
jgi:hypothetical protein